MGRARISGAQGSGDTDVKRQKRPRGLAVVARDGFWHIHGTLRLNGRQRRVRKSTGLPATAENAEAAEAARHQTETEVRNELLYGVMPSKPIEVVANAYFNETRKSPLNEIDVSRIEEIVKKFRGRMINRITDAEWHDFINERMKGRKAATRERYLNALMALLNYAAQRKWLRELPVFKRDNDVRKPKSRERRRVVELTPELIGMMVEEAAPHLRAQIAAMWSAGARVSSMLYGCRFCDVVLTPGKEQITFRDTKNGDDVPASLHPFAADILRDYVEHRGEPKERESPFFLTDEGLPYADNGRAFGGQTKTAFRGMKKRVIARLKAQGRHAEAELIGKVTPHWLRHALATNMLARGADLASIMAQGGWRTIESVKGYAHVVPDHQRDAVNKLEAPDTSLTRASEDETRKDDTSTE